MAEITNLENDNQIILHFHNDSISVDKKILKKMEYFNALLTRWEDKSDIKMPDYIDQNTFLELIRTLYFKNYKSSDPNLNEYQDYFGCKNKILNCISILNLNKVKCIIDISKINYVEIMYLEQSCCTNDKKNKHLAFKIKYNSKICRDLILQYFQKTYLLNCCDKCKSYINMSTRENIDIYKLIREIEKYSNKTKKDLFGTNKELQKNLDIDILNCHNKDSTEYQKLIDKKENFTYKPDKIFIIENSVSPFINLAEINSISIDSLESDCSKSVKKNQIYIDMELTDCRILEYEPLAKCDCEKCIKLVFDDNHEDKLDNLIRKISKYKSKYNPEIEIEVSSLIK